MLFRRRGIPGADITVYIKEVDLSGQASTSPGEAFDKADPNGAGTGDSSGNGNGSNGAGALEKDKIGTVEIKETEGLRCLVVWKERNKEIEERALRRLGFELGEWVRTTASPAKT